MDKSMFPKLAPPGAGLPWLENIILRYFYFPVKVSQSDWSGNLQRLTRETQKIVSFCQKLEENKFQTRVLIPRLRGMEDSSRFWSVALTMEHLMISMRGMSMIAYELAQGKSLDVDTDVAKVKPKQEDVTTKDKMIELFTKISDEVVAKLKPLEQNHSTENKVHHPWFGKINCEGWVWTLGQHQSLHRRQIQMIIAQL